MYFFNDSIAIYTIAFASLFDNFKIQRVDKKTDPYTIREIPVPITYSNKSHWYLKKYKKLPDEKNISTILPLITFNLEGMESDVERQTNKFEILKFTDSSGEPLSANVRNWIQTAVPHTFDFSVNIWTKYQTEMNQILEQILPFYPTDSRDLHIKEIPMLGIYRSTKVTLDSNSQDITVEYDENEDRIIKCELLFSLDGYLYPPIKKSHIIENVNMKIYIDTISKGYDVEELVITEDDVEFIDSNNNSAQ